MMFAPAPLEHPRYKVVPRASRKLVIFFSGTGAADGVFHWWKMGTRIDASVIYVNNGRNEWYMRGIPGLGDSYEATCQSFAAWARYLGATEIYTCGGSMGGSGALIYGVRLNARVLGMGFETHLDSPWGNVQRLMAKDFEPAFRNFRPLVRSATKRIVVVAGESEPVDLVSAAHISDLPQVETITLRQVGHGPPSHLRNRGKLDSFFDAFLNDQDIPALANQGRGVEIEGFAATLYAAYCADKEKRWQDGRKLAATAVALYPQSEYAHMLLGKSHLLLGEPNEALGPLETAISLHRQNREALFFLAIAMEKEGDLQKAVQAHKSILEVWPDFGRSHYRLGCIYASKHSFKSALKRLETAISLDPHRPNFVAKLNQVRYQYERSAALS